jgi:hypothetical protein
LINIILKTHFMKKIISPLFISYFHYFFFPFTFFLFSLFLFVSFLFFIPFLFSFSFPSFSPVGLLIQFIAVAGDGDSGAMATGDGTGGSQGGAGRRGERRQPRRRGVEPFTEVARLCGQPRRGGRRRLGRRRVEHQLGRARPRLQRRRMEQWLERQQEERRWKFPLSGAKVEPLPPQTP